MGFLIDRYWFGKSQGRMKMHMKVYINLKDGLTNDLEFEETTHRCFIFHISKISCIDKRN